MAIRIYLAGRVAVENNGRLVFDQTAFRGRQPKLLFVYFVIRRNSEVSRDELANLLWPDQLPSGWQGSLNALISRIRTVLAANIPPDAISLSNTAGNYMLSTSSDAWIDIEAVDSALDEAEGALRLGRISDAWGPANVAATIAQRPFLTDIEGEQIDSIRAHLNRQYLRAVECLASIWLARRETGPAIEALSRAIKIDPYRESSFRMLIQAHELEGNRALGVLAYEQLRDRLLNDLQVEPSPESEAVYRSLIAND